MCFYQVLRLQKREKLIWGVRGMSKVPEEACIRERKGLDTGGSSMSRGQVCVKAPGLNEGWS